MRHSSVQEAKRATRQRALARVWLTLARMVATLWILELWREANTRLQHATNAPSFRV